MEPKTSTIWRKFQFHNSWLMLLMHPNQRARHRRPARSTKNSSSRLSLVGPARSQASLDQPSSPPQTDWIFSATSVLAGLAYALSSQAGSRNRLADGQTGGRLVELSRIGARQQPRAISSKRPHQRYKCTTYQLHTNFNNTKMTSTVANKENLV